MVNPVLSTDTPSLWLRRFLAPRPRHRATEEMTCKAALDRVDHLCVPARSDDAAEEMAYTAAVDRLDHLFVPAVSCRAMMMADLAAATAHVDCYLVFSEPSSGTYAIPPKPGAEAGKWAFHWNSYGPHRLGFCPDT